MKKITRLLITLVSSILIFTSIPFSANAKENTPVQGTTYITESPITSLETGKEIGTKKITTTVEVVQKSSTEKEHTVTSDIVNTYKDGNTESETQIDVYKVKNDTVIEYNNKPVEESFNLAGTYAISQKDLEKITPYAEKFKNGEISYEEYVEAIKSEGVSAYSTDFSVFGGLKYVTWYGRNSYTGGYDLLSAQMNGFWDSALNSLMLDPAAVNRI